MFFFDVAYSKYQYFFQDPASPVMEGIINFHHDLLSIQLFIGFFVLWFLLRICFCCRLDTCYVGSTSYAFTFKFFGFKFQIGIPTIVGARQVIHRHITIRRLFWGPSRGPVHNTYLEIFWTVIPACILIYIAIPSFALLYSIDELHNPEETYIISGNQWYWIYERAYMRQKCSPELGNIFSPVSMGFNNVLGASDVEESFLLGEKKVAKRWVDSRLNLNVQKTLFEKGWPYDYLLATDKALLLPLHKRIRLLITSNDVLHSWTIPSFGVKLDACPGRLNQTGLTLKRLGLFYGQCSEICGVNHAFMPITVRVVLPTDMVLNNGRGAALCWTRSNYLATKIL